jgi:hypothetical protein
MKACIAFVCGLATAYLWPALIGAYVVLRFH